MSTDAHLYRLMKSAPDSSEAVAYCNFDAMLHAPADCKPYPQHHLVSAAYERALRTYETVLREWIQASTVSLMKAVTLDADFVAVMKLVADERFDVDITKHEVMGQLWTVLGGNKRRLLDLSKHEDVLNRVGEFTITALRYVRSVQDALEGMQRHLEELRQAAIGALISDIVEPEVILEMLSRGLERLGDARYRMALGGRSDVKHIYGVQREHR